MAEIWIRYPVHRYLVPKLGGEGVEKAGLAGRLHQHINIIQQFILLITKLI
jgi:hypothetical protein